MRPGEAAAFERYCARLGFKKSTLIARLIREHLDREGHGGAQQPRLAGQR
jgi:hypothetical protein